MQHTESSNKQQNHQEDSSSSNNNIPNHNEHKMAPRSDQKDDDNAVTLADEIVAAGNGAAAEDGAEVVHLAADALAEDDPETAELARLRCESVRTEEKKQPGARVRCADYPGLAFGSAMFGSDTMMKFNIIKNELHNIMRSQLKRVDGEVSAMAQRIKALDDNLALSEQYIKTATATLAEAVEHEREHNRAGEMEEDNSALSQFDAQMVLLGHRLLHAKMLAAEAAGENEPIQPVVRHIVTETLPEEVQTKSEPEVELSETKPAAVASSTLHQTSTPRPLAGPQPLRRPFASSAPAPQKTD